MAVHRKESIADAVAQNMEGRTLGVKHLVKAGAEHDTLILTAFRIGQRKRDLLRDHFADRGLELGTGIRLVLYEYMKREGIR